MKTVYTHNTTLTPIPGWKTICKRPTAIIEDKDNHYFFEIVFGKKPKMRCYRTEENGDIIEEIQL